LEYLEQCSSELWARGLGGVAAHPLDRIAFVTRRPARQFYCSPASAIEVRRWTRVITASYPGTWCTQTGILVPPQLFEGSNALA